MKWLRYLLAAALIAVAVGVVFADIGKQPTPALGVRYSLRETILPQAADTVTFDTRDCDIISLSGGFVGDSATVYVDWGYNNGGTIVWTNVLTTTYADTAAATTVNYYHQFQHNIIESTAADTVALYRDFMWPMMRLRVSCDDDSASDSDDIDTLTSANFNLMCR